MLTRFYFMALCLTFPSFGQERLQSGEFKGFTKSATEHIISRIDEPFRVTSVHRMVVFKDRNDGLKEVLLEIRGPGNSEHIRATKSNGDGSFRILHVPEGTYAFKATKNGFQSVVGTIVISKKADKPHRIKIGMAAGV